MKIIKANGWYINLDQVTYIHTLNQYYVKVGYINDSIELANEDATAFLEALEVIKDDHSVPADLTMLKRNALE